MSTSDDTDIIEFMDASISDRDAIHSLLCQLEHPIEKDILLNNIKNKLQREDYRLFVAKANNNVVAVAELHFEHFLHEPKGRARLTVFCVDAKFRNKKIGVRFLEFLETIAKQRDVARFEVTSNIRRENAHRFYENNGYSFTSKAFFKDL